MITCHEIIENSPFAMAITEGPGHKLHFVNSAFCLLQHKNADEIVGHPIMAAISGANSHDVLQLLDGVYGGAKSSFVNHLQQDSDRSHDLNYKSYLAWSLSGINERLDGLVIQVTDFSKPWPLSDHDQIAVEEQALNGEIRQINERLVLSALHQQTLAEMAADSELRLRSLIQGLHAIVCEYDGLTDTFTFVSERAESFLGYSIERWNESDFWKQIIHEDDYEDAVAGFRAVSQPDEGRQYTFRVTAANGCTIWLRNIVNVVRTPDGAIATRRCVIVDATEQQAAHELLTAEMERNRAIAEAMQYSILWRQPVKLFPGLTVASFYEPAAGDALVGGDFFDAFRLSDGAICLVVGDVTGKGLKAAARTVEVTFALRAFANEYNDAAKIINRLNEFICDFHYADDGNADNALIVLSLVVIDPITGTARVASGGAERPFILRADGVVDEIAADGLILGIDRDAFYGTAEVSLQLGDTLFMTTDGIPDARRGQDFFGYERLIETARRTIKTGTPHEIGKAIVDSAHAYTGGLLTDDICLLVVQRESI